MLASSAIRESRRAGIGAEALTPVGSLRRFAPDVGDVSLLGIVPAARHQAVLRAFARLPIVVEAGKATSSSVTATTARGNVTLYLAIPEHAGGSLVWHTGSRAHVEQLRHRAERLGLRFADGRLARVAGADIEATTEDEFYARLDLPCIPPELRDGDSEIATAERDGLPILLSELHIRGDLHMHSTWSDGRDPISDMVSASKQLGYEYVAITDHSERAWSSRTLAAADVPKQRDEIARLRARTRGIEILHGVEVDIMADGSLDFDDHVLEGFDIVLASLHDHCGHEGDRLTERYLSAIRHPLVNVITHPANRTPAQSHGYSVDFDRLFEAAADSGTAMEVDGTPGHLDMDGSVA